MIHNIIIYHIIMSVAVTMELLCHTKHIIIILAITFPANL